MKSFTVCVLYVVAAINAVCGELPVLGPLKSLRIVEGNGTSAVLAWIFEKPKDVLLSEIEFILLLEIEEKPILNLNSRFEAPPLNITLTGLSSRFMYTVKLRAAHPDWQDSPTAEMSFGLRERDPPILNTPTNLRIGRESNTSAILFWDFEKPEDVPLSKIGFVLLLKSRGKPDTEICPRFTHPPFSHSLTGLTPKTMYTVTIKAHTASWRASPIANVSFTTPKIDWPTPVIAEVHSTPRVDFVLFTVKWDLEKLLDQLLGYKIEVCAPKCSETRKGRDYVGVILPIVYETNFTMRVIAEYELPVLGLIQRPSGFYSGKTGKASMKRTLSAVKAVEEGNKVTLAWLPSFAPQGPIPYYEFFICDARSRSSVLSKLFKIDEFYPAPKLVRRPPPLNGTVFAMTLGGRASKTGQSYSAGANQCPPPHPLHLAVIKKLESAVRFRIFFRDNTGDRFGAELESESLRMGPAFAEAFDLPAYTVFSVKIRSCLTQWRQVFDVCGNFSNFEMLSNVAGPSRVENLEHHLRNSDDELEITWQAPRAPRGPIDGYKVSVQQKSPERPTSSVFFVPRGKRTPPNDQSRKVFMLNSTTLSFVLEDSQPTETYLVGVVAFNLGIEDRAQVFEGEWSYLTVPSEKSSVGWLWVVIGFILIVSVLLAAVYAYYKLRLVPNREAQRPEFVPLRPIASLLPPDYNESRRSSHSLESSSEFRLPVASRQPPGIDDDDDLPPYEDIGRYPFCSDERPPRYEDVVSLSSSASSTEGFVARLSDTDEVRQPDAADPQSDGVENQEAELIAPPPSIASGSEVLPSRLDVISEESQEDVGGTTGKLPLDVISLSSQAGSSGCVASPSSDSAGSGFSSARPNAKRDGSLPDVRSPSPESIPSPLTGNFPPPPSRASSYGSSPSMPTVRSEESRHDVDSPRSVGSPRLPPQGLEHLPSEVESSGYVASQSLARSSSSFVNADRDESPSDLGSLSPESVPSPLDGHLPPPPSRASSSTLSSSKSAESNEEVQLDVVTSPSGSGASAMWSRNEGDSLRAAGISEQPRQDVTSQSSEGGSSGYVPSLSSGSCGSGFSSVALNAERDGSLPDVGSLSADSVPSPVDGHFPPPSSLASSLGSLPVSTGDDSSQRSGGGVSPPVPANQEEVQQRNRQENQRRHPKQRKQRRNR